MAVCDVCGKHPRFGHHVSHSNRKTPRRWEPNVQRATLLLDGRLTSLRLCTRCLRDYGKLPK